jgi:competence ComEA-like helix-hairpin-helix protein
MNIFQKLSEKIGLTQTELKVFAFLAAVFIIGLIVKSLNWENESSAKNNFDYTAMDSIFYASDNLRSSKSENDLLNSKVDSSDFNLNKKKYELTEKSINLNKASLEELVMLPGIGIKTAERILAYRKASGGFNNIEELMEVERIGESKFNKIKKYIYVR